MNIKLQTERLNGEPYLGPPLNSWVPYCRDARDFKPLLTADTSRYNGGPNLGPPLNRWVPYCRGARGVTSPS